MTNTEPLTRHFNDVEIGETVFAYGVPFEITAAAKTTPEGTEHSPQCRQVTWMVGTYRGKPLSTYAEGNPLAPFITKAGDEWTMQKRTDIAHVYSFDGGATWHHTTH